MEEHDNVTYGGVSELAQMTFEELVEYCKFMGKKTGDMIPLMFRRLILQGMHPYDAADLIRRRLIEIGWSRTFIYAHMPEEGKRPERVAAGKQRGQSHEQNEAFGGSGQVTEMEEDTASPKGSASGNIDGLLGENEFAELPTTGHASRVEQFSEKTFVFKPGVVGKARAANWDMHAIVLRDDGSFVLVKHG